MFRDHFQSLRRTGEPRPRFRVWLLHIGLPMAVGAGVAWAGFRIDDGAQIIAGSAILAGFAFGMAVFVFQLRLESARDPRIERGAYLLDLLDELFTNVLYLITSGLVVVAAAVAATSFTREVPTPAPGTTPPVATAAPEPLSAPWTAVLLALSVHYLITLLVCVVRLRRSYDEMTI